jgi:hypothetical protein
MKGRSGHAQVLCGFGAFKKQSDPIEKVAEQADLPKARQTDFEEEQTQSDDTEMISAIIGSL